MNIYAPNGDWKAKTLQIPQANSGFNFQDLFRILLRRKLIVCAVPIVALAAGLAVFASVTPRYTARAQILIDPKTPDSLGPGTNFGAAVLVDSAKINGVTSMIESSELLDRVVQSEKLYQDPELAKTRPSRLAWLISLFRSTPPSVPSEREKADAAREQLAKLTTVTREGMTYIITVSVNSSDPAKAARLAQAISETYLDDQLQSKQDSAHRATSLLVDRLAEMRKELIRSEEAVAEIRRNYGLTATDGTGSSTVASQQITELNATLNAAEAELSKKQAKVEQAHKVRDSGGNIESLPEVMASSVIGALRAQQADIARKLAEMQPLPSQRDMPAMRPEVIRKEEARRAIDGQITIEVNRIIANLENDYTASKDNAAALRQQLKKLTGENGGLQNADGQAKLKEALSVAEADRASYVAMLSKFNELEQSQKLQEPEARLIEKARIPDQASYPRLPIFIFASFGPGLLLGIGFAFVAELLSPNRKKASAFLVPTQIEQNLQIPMLASVPRLNVKEVGGKASVDILQYLVENQFSHFAEALRCIRFSIRRGNGREPTKIIQITSAIAGEGKSTLASALALSAALSGERVILVDCDFRRPNTTKLFKLSGSEGLGDLLAGRAAWGDMKTTHPKSSLTVVPIGKSDQNSPDLVTSSEMAKILKFAAEHYDLVFLDSPPILPVPDAAAISGLAQKTIVLVEWNKTDRDLVTQAIERINAHNGAVSGVVLNKVDVDLAKSYGYGYSKYFCEIEKYYNNDYA